MRLLNRKPDVVVGHASSPRSRRWILFQFRGLVVCVHQFLRPDPPGMHDHHSWNVSLVLRGVLLETRPGRKLKILTPGRVVFRRAKTPHHLTPILSDLVPVWTLFVIGPPRRKWGYWRDGKWIPWDQA